VPRILLLVTDLEIGGTPTVVRELAIRIHKHFAQARSASNTVHVACLSPSGPVAEQLKSAGVPVTALNARGPRDLFVIARLNGLLHEHGFDTVFSFLIHANAAAAATALANPRIRYIQSIQTTQPTPRWHWWLQRLVHRMAERIIVPSESVAEAARCWSHIPSEKISVIPNAIDLAEFADVKPVEGNPRPFPIGFLGRLDPIKRIPDLLEAVRQLNGLVHLNIFGAGPEQAALEQIIGDLKIQNLVTMHGSIARPQDALAQIGLLVLPSAAEGFGLVLIEAMVAGVPVVATNVPGIRDVVRDGQTGLLVPPASPQALASAIAGLVDDSGLRHRLTTRAAADVAERFAWERVWSRYQSLLELRQA
jgi:glycosyltransferase involved in cell wall biosynthesis